MSNKVIYAIYNDDDILMDAVKKPEQLIIILKKFYPFPVHGLDKAMGIAPTRLAFVLSLWLYNSVATAMMNYIMIQDWPQDIGGKPSFSYIENMPAFVPIMFELTVFLRLT
jgi:hypothetical protein